MSYHYTDESRESDDHALPDIEIFYDDSDVPEWGGEPRNYDSDGDPIQPGWYYWSCFPGCMPDSDPMGPYDTEQDALDAARED